VARQTLTVVLIAFAVLSEPAVGAEALEVVVLIQGARTAVDARRRRALAERGLAAGSGPSGVAFAFVLVDPVVAGPSVEARVRLALVDICGADWARVAGHALADEPVDLVDARRPLQTRLARTLVIRR
jgi:hypothetical protein